MDSETGKRESTGSLNSCFLGEKFSPSVTGANVSSLYFAYINVWCPKASPCLQIKPFHPGFLQKTNISLDFQRLSFPNSNFSDQWAITTREQICEKDLNFWKCLLIVCQFYVTIYFLICTKIWIFRLLDFKDKLQMFIICRTISISCSVSPPPPHTLHIQPFTKDVSTCCIVCLSTHILSSSWPITSSLTTHMISQKTSSLTSKEIHLHSPFNYRYPRTTVPN